VDYLCEECRTHFEAVQRYLALYEIPYRLSHRLVRGIDYYTRTTFEVLGHALGAQNALLGGGRYDGLVKHLGGPDRVGIGFAAGIERLVLALPEGAGAVDHRVEVFVAAHGDEPRIAALRLLRDLRRAGISAQTEYEARSLKSQFKRADRLGAPLVFVIGEEELARGEVAAKDMKKSTQETIRRDEAIAYCLGRRRRPAGRDERRGTPGEE
jgi:histidyl-tRNA synthetase